MPKFKIPEYFDIAVLENELLFKTEENIVSVQGRSTELIKKILKYLDGSNSIDDIAKKTKLSIQLINDISSKLSQAGLVFDEEKTLYKHQYKDDKRSNFFSKKKGLNNRFVPLKNLEMSSALLIGVNPIIKIISNSLSSYGVDITNKNTLNYKSANSINSDIVVICESNSGLHSSINKTFLKKDKKWIGVRFYGAYGEIGPFVIPYKSPCYECYNLRIKSNLNNKELAFSEFSEKSKICKVYNYGLPSFYNILGELAAIEVIRILSKYEKPKTLGNVMRIDFNTQIIEHVPFLKIPNCLSCGYG